MYEFLYKNENIKNEKLVTIRIKNYKECDINDINTRILVSLFNEFDKIKNTIHDTKKINEIIRSFEIVMGSIRFQALDIREHMRICSDNLEFLTTTKLYVDLAENTRFLLGILSELIDSNIKIEIENYMPTDDILMFKFK